MASNDIQKGDSWREAQKWCGSFPRDYFGTAEAAERKVLDFSLPNETQASFVKMGKGNPLKIFFLLMSGASILFSKNAYSKNISYTVRPLRDNKKGFGEAKNKDTVLMQVEMQKEDSFQELTKAIAIQYIEKLKSKPSTMRNDKDLGEIKLIGQYFEEDVENPAEIMVEMGMEGLHMKPSKEKQEQKLSFFFSYLENEGEIRVKIIYPPTLFALKRIKALRKHLLNLYTLLGQNPNCVLGEMDIRSKEEKHIMERFHGKRINPLPKEGVISSFKKILKNYSEKTALVEGEKKLSYQELENYSQQIANFLRKYVKGVESVGIFLPNSILHVASILGTLKIGAAYVPLEVTWPLERLEKIVEDLHLECIITNKEGSFICEKLQMEYPYLYRILQLEDNQELEKEDGTKNPVKKESYLSHRELWEYVGQEAEDEIEGGGWKSSYTGEYFSKEEMEEYTNNILHKLSPLLKGEENVLEIGCASGLSMFPLSKKVAYYLGTDLSQSILDKNQKRIVEEGITNIALRRMEALDIDCLGEEKFSVFILNSVLQCFPNYEYFRQVFEKILSLAKNHSILYLGDVMDGERKQELIHSLREYANNHSEEAHKVKLDWSEELFFSKDFFRHLAEEYPCIKKVEISAKEGEIKNELTSFRYDVVLFVDKSLKKSISEKSMSLARLILQRQENLIGEEYDKESNTLSTSIDNTAYIIYTSGTTGSPKGIRISEQSLMNFVIWHNRYFQVNEQEISTRYAQCSFDASVWELFPFLLAGGEIHILPQEIRKDPKALNQYFMSNHVSFSFLPTQMAEQFLLEENDSLRILVTGGDRLRKWKKKPYHFYNAYGPTENTIMSTITEITEENAKILPIGKAIDGVELFLVDPYGAPQCLDCPGELWLGGLNLAKSYVNCPKENASFFTEHKLLGRVRLYHTGDLVQWLQEGELQFLGRIDGQVKISSFRMEIREIELAILSLPSVKDIVVHQSQKKDQLSLHAYIQLKQDGWTEEDIREALSKILPSYMIPGRISIVDSFPITANGKIDYKALECRVIKQRKEVIKNGKEAKILAAFRKVLDNEEIGVCDNFFSVGGNSIQAIRLASILEKNFYVKINELFVYQTVRELSENLEVKSKAETQDFSLLKRQLAVRIDKENHPEYFRRQEAYLQSVAYEKTASLNVSKYHNLLLTGSTGFLGIHLLREILLRSSAKIYLPIRASSAVFGKKRLEEAYYHFYQREIKKTEWERIKIIPCDLEKKYFGLGEDKFRSLGENIDCILNAAANVKHFGERSSFYPINTELIDYLVELASFGKKTMIHHVSTIGVAEGRIRNNTSKVEKRFFFTEEDLDVGQESDNLYTNSKLDAERKIADYRKQGVPIAVYRVGNLVGDSETGIFQKNIGDNGFYKILRALLYFGKIPEQFPQEMDFSFIDQVAEAVFLLCFSSAEVSKNYHILNRQNYDLGKFVEVFQEISKNVELLSLEKFIDFMAEEKETRQDQEAVLDFLVHSRLLDSANTTSFHIASEKTEYCLKTLGFSWKVLNRETLEKLLFYGEKLGFWWKRS
jgi:putative AMP-binding enzyme